MEIIDTNLTLAVRCRECGRIKFHKISLFELSLNNPVEFNCTCGNVEALIHVKKNKNIMIDIPCIACDNTHTFKYSLQDVIKRKVSVICCAETGFELCFLGWEEEVKRVVLKYQQDLDLLLGELGINRDLEEDLLKSIIKRIP